MENYKQLTEDLATGKNLLLDYNNNEIECTKYGLKKPKYSRNITGQSSFQNRFNKGLMKKIKYDPSQYLPGSNRLLGSPMFLVLIVYLVLRCIRDLFQSRFTIRKIIKKNLC